MTELTKQRLKEIVNAAGGEPCDYEEVFDGIKTGEIVSMARQLLASMEAEPVGSFHIVDQQVDGTTDYIKDGEWPIDNGKLVVYAVPPAPRVDAEPVAYEIIAEAWRLMDGQKPETAEWHSAASRYLNAYSRAAAAAPVVSDDVAFEKWWEDEKYDEKLAKVQGVMFNRVKNAAFKAWVAAGRAAMLK